MIHGVLIYSSKGTILKASTDWERWISKYCNSSDDGPSAVSLLAKRSGIDEARFYLAGELSLELDGHSEPLLLRVEPLDDGASVLYAAECKSDAAGSQFGGDYIGFLTTVSHELRVPLNGIIGFAALLEKSGLNAKQADILEKLQASNYLLKGLINDILEFSRVRSAVVDLKKEVVDLGRFAADLGSLFADRAERRGLSLSVEAGSAVGRRVILPKLRVTQVLTNLISNALKFTRSGSIVMRAKIAESKGEPRAYFEIEDTGIGVPEDKLKEIFKPFGQLHANDGESRAEGHGLGLAISKGLVNVMEGELAYRRGVSGGSCFSFDVPCPFDGERHFAASPGLGQQRRIDPETSEPLREERSKKRILVVEDNQLNADILSHFLRDYGFMFDVVNNGARAVKAASETRYDSILMDIMLPELNGYEATERILEKAPKGEAPVVIGVTAKVFRNDRQRCLECGMSEVVHKPVDFKLLREVLDEWLFGRNPSPPIGSYRSPPQSRTGILDEKSLVEYCLRVSDGAVGDEQAIARFLGAIASSMNDLRSAVEADSREEIERHAHSIKGSLGLVGAWNMQDLAKGLELAAGKRGGIFRASHWLAVLEAAHKELEGALTRHLIDSESRCEK